jgi:hypothetical protein
MMAQQPIWKIAIPDELDVESVEEVLAETDIRQKDGTGLQIERLDISSDRSTEVFVSGSEADARMLLARIGKRWSQLADGVKYVACSMEELHRTGSEALRRPQDRRQ